MSNAFIIGNGTSRKGFDLDELAKHGTTFGCNRIFQEFRPNYLIAIDDAMIDVIRGSTYPQHRILIPPEHERWELSGSGRRSNAGMNAMNEAVRRGHDRLFCLGFDFLLESESASETMYDGQAGYDPAKRATDDDNIHPMLYLDWFAGANSTVIFDFVFPRSKISIRPVKSPNIRGLFYDDLKRVLKS